MCARVCARVRAGVFVCVCVCVKGIGGSGMHMCVPASVSDMLGGLHSRSRGLHIHPYTPTHTQL